MLLDGNLSEVLNLNLVICLICMKMRVMDC